MKRARGARATCPGRYSFKPTPPRRSVLWSLHNKKYAPTRWDSRPSCINWGGIPKHAWRFLECQHALAWPRTEDWEGEEKGGRGLAGSHSAFSSQTETMALGSAGETVGTARAVLTEWYVWSYKWVDSIINYAFVSFSPGVSFLFLLICLSVSPLFPTGFVYSFHRLRRWRCPFCCLSTSTAIPTSVKKSVRCLILWGILSRFSARINVGMFLLVYDGLFRRFAFSTLKKKGNASVVTMPLMF